MAVRPLARTVMVLSAFGCYGLNAEAVQSKPGDVPIEEIETLMTAPRERSTRRHRPKLAAVQFNPAFLNGQVVSISRFTNGNPVPAGVYDVDLSLNGKAQGQREVQFVAMADSDVAEPCFTIAALRGLGVDVDKALRSRVESAGAVTGDATGSAAFYDDGQCVRLADLVPDARAEFDLAELQLDITVPQASIVQTPYGYVSPALWDAGIKAGLLQYNFTTYSANQSGADVSSAYLGLQLGLNLGQWRFRQRSTLDWNSNVGGMRWNNLATYVERDLTSWRSRLTFGDSFTTGEVFDSFSVRGVQISSEDRMLPDSMRAYAPIVRGVAESNARVIVRQNNDILYETSVPPGPFELGDLPAIGYGGDLRVTVEEADGRRQTFLVPFAAVPNLLRPGFTRFNVSAGQYRDQLVQHEPWVVQATIQRGLSNMLTGYTGVLTSEGYSSGLLGLAVNTPVGAVSADVTMARTDLASSSHTGSSWRVSYSKRIPAIETNLLLGAYRYSTDGFYSLRDAIYARNVGNPGGNLMSYRTRNRLQLSINQPLGTMGSMYLSGSTQDYWDGGRGRDTQYQAGFTGGVGRVAYTIYAQQSFDQNRSKHTQFGVNLTISLGRNSAVERGPFDSLSTNVTVDTHGDSAFQASLNGATAGEAPISYGMNVQRTSNSGDHTNQLGGNATYRARYGTYAANASLGNRGRQIGLNADGSIVAHAGGITLGPPLGQAAALVEAKGAEGGRIVNGQGARIDGNGYALLPSLTPYRVNRVAIDPTDLPDDVELETSSDQVVPRLNALVLVKMPTVTGKAALVAMHDHAGEPLPLGTALFSADGKSMGIVGQGGLAFLRGLEGSGALRAQWGESTAESCELPYAMPAGASVDGGTDPGARLTLRCEAAAS
ncbi:Outer membrane usher protein HtrE [Cupriavidus campinensis]|nr:Outer membrane usher protein HtrE [Cupriavidus campinensis]